MLARVANGVWTHQSALLENNTVIVQGDAGLLLVDPGLTNDDFADLSNDLRALDQPVAAGFATHPHWDHVLWHADLGDVPRYAAITCVAEMQALLAQPDWKQRAAAELPEEIAAEVPLDLFGQLTALADSSVPWDGPVVRIVEHRGHAPGHSALLVEGTGALIAGDMLSDVFPPMPSFDEPSWAEDYLAGLQRLEETAAQVVIPGHGSVSREVQRRIDVDRAYIVALRDGAPISDPRIDAPKAGWEWVTDFLDYQRGRASA